MVNDLNTLSGALVECKDQLITELANKGVTASYSSTTGLLGLIHKINEIPSGGGTIVFEDDQTNDKTLFYPNRLGRTNYTFTFDSTNKHYVLSPPTGDGTFIGLSPVVITSNTNWKTRVDVSSGAITGILLIKHNTSHYISFSIYFNNQQAGIYDYGNGNGWIHNLSNVNISSANFYTAEWSINNNTVTCKIFDGSTELYNKTFTLPSEYQDSTVYPCVTTYGNGNSSINTTKFKNFKVEYI